MHKLESVLAKETHKILWDFEMQTDPLTPDRISDLVMINKNNNNKESEKRDIILSNHCMYIQDLASNNRYVLICHKTKPNPIDFFLELRSSRNHSFKDTKGMS